MRQKDETGNGLAKELASILSRGSEKDENDPHSGHLTSAVGALSDVIDQNGLGVSLADARGTLVYVNETYAAMHGWSPAELLGQPASILHTSPESRLDSNEALENEPSVTHSGQSRRYRRDGSVFFATADSVPFHDKCGDTRGVLTTISDVTGIEDSRQEVHSKRGRLEEILDSVTDHIIMLDDRLSIVWLNQVARDFAGPDVEGRKCYEALRGRDNVCEPCLVAETFADGQVHEYECQTTGKDGQARTFLRTVSVAARYPDDRPRLVVEVSRDITERKHSEKLIKASLKEKEARLREIHHRVKNNLQVISSLLRLQSRYCEDQGSREIFSECEVRVQSIALVYEKLHSSEDPAGIDFEGYCKSLVPHLFSTFDADPKRIRLKTDIDRIPIKADLAVPCGLIANELLSNCIKHAFPGTERGLIEISLKTRPDNLIELAVQDNGVGLPDGFDPADAESLGLRLVRTLARQLHASVQVDTEQGTRFTIAFRPSSAPAS